MFGHQVRSHRWSAFILTLITALFFSGIPAPAAAVPDPWSYPLPGRDAATPLQGPFTYPAYTYESAFRLLQFRTEKAPGPAELEVLGPADDYLYGTYENMLAKWRDSSRQKRGDAGWSSFVKAYVNGVDSNNKGSAFEQLVFRLERIGPDDYMFDMAPPGAPTSKQPDAFPRQPDKGPGMEVKNTRVLSNRAREQLDGYVKNVDALYIPMVYIFRERPTPTTLKLIRQANEKTEVNQARIKAGLPPVPAIVARLIPAIGQKVPLKDAVGDAALRKLWERRVAEAQGGHVKWNGPPPMPPDNIGALTAPDLGQIPADGAFDDAIQRSAASAEDAAAERQAREDLGKQFENPDLAEDAPGGDAIGKDQIKELGGVDFSTLELRYVSDAYHNGSSVQYAFKADPLPADQQSFGGRRAAQLASDSFFTWLALSPDKFWVNLNPDEPDRIIDAQFGKTDAGRVLLEADLQMKKTVAKLIHPDTPGGKKYWDALQGEGKCLGTRLWIVPGPAVVRDNGDELFLLEAPLQVKSESETTKAQGAVHGCDGEDPSTTRHNEKVDRTMILPQVQDAVNHAPEYADLRRVYASRVAAEWFRKRSATKHTAYSDLIGKGDISRWQSREPWTPREVFDRYVQSYKNGEFNITRQREDGQYIYTQTYVYGGVDFSNVVRKQVEADKFANEHSGLETSVSDALHTQSDDGRGMWLGGLTTSVPLTEAFAEPEPGTSKPLLYVLTSLPLVAWLGAGAWLLLRRRAWIVPIADRGQA